MFIQTIEDKKALPSYTCTIFLNKLYEGILYRTMLLIPKKTRKHIYLKYDKMSFYFFLIASHNCFTIYFILSENKIVYSLVFLTFSDRCSYQLTSVFYTFLHIQFLSAFS